MNGSGHRSRKHPIHLAPIESGNLSIIVFLTVCTRGRRPLLANQRTHLLLRSAWTRAQNWLVGRYAIMPDHIHLFCAPGLNPPAPLKPWVTCWQNLVTRSWPSPDEKPLWQKDWWDRQLRCGESYKEKWHYVADNPVRHGLAGHPGLWPYQGELNALHWHDR